MASLELRVRASSPDTCTVGEIFPDPRGTHPPVVNDVRARPTRSKLFQLAPGDYTYFFHVEGTGGKVTLTIVGTGNDTDPTLALDTAKGFSGWSLDFSVV
jgi:hypothetical protein